MISYKKAINKLKKFHLSIRSERILSKNSLFRICSPLCRNARPGCAAANTFGRVRSGLGFPHWYERSGKRHT